MLIEIAPSELPVDLEVVSPSRFKESVSSRSETLPDA